MENKEDEQITLGWNFRRIIFAVLSFVIIIGTGLFFLDKEFKNFSADKKTVESKVLGLTEENKSGKEEINLPFEKKDVENVVTQIKENIETITPESIASASPEIQKVLNDIKAIENYKKEPVNVICDIVCKK